MQSQNQIMKMTNRNSATHWQDWRWPEVFACLGNSFAADDYQVRRWQCSICQLLCNNPHTRSGGDEIQTHYYSECEWKCFLLPLGGVPNYHSHYSHYPFEMMYHVSIRTACAQCSRREKWIVQHGRKLHIVFQIYIVTVKHNNCPNEKTEWS